MTVEIDEVAARVVRTYWALLLAALVLPVLAVGWVMHGRTPPEVAQTRVQASSNAADAVAGDAGVAIVVSQVKAYATSRNLLDGVLRDTRLDRDPVKLAKNISVTGLGTSTVVELSVKDAAGPAARTLADAVAAAVVKEINDSNQGAAKAQIAAIDKRIRTLEGRLGPLSERAGAVPQPDIAAGNERERVQAELTDLRTNRSALVTQLTAAGNATVVQPAVLRPKQNPVVMMAAIAGLVGLVAGILVAVVIEMFRPTVPGPQRVARKLGVPLLGWADRGDAELAALGRRIRLAARRAGVAQVTLTGPGSAALPADLVSKVAAAVYGDDAKLVSARPVKGTGPDGDGDGGVRTGGATDENDEPTVVTPAIGSNSAGSNSGKPSPGKGHGTSVVRAGARTSLLNATSGAVAAAADAPTAPQRAVCHVHAFEDLDLGAGERVGLVAVAGPVTTVAGLDSVRDLVAASGWPLLGVIATSRKIKG
ncbi:hypothetical protein [Actinomadura parmotrematis]|uniref:Polysaccharide chain length determinant N-terminal domain-containing protein n=1 Tax=Actinomadura parmotrematis TaxID=2864039 RepID=A0ABS7FUA1_9ACTN|nr:hypothetical protein [Actinomadura parmotrematis]MBW8483992.1 hypothetical protein [Actinomadura parmotrematis]